MTPDQVAVAALIEEVDRNAPTIRFLLSEARVHVGAPIEDTLQHLTQTGLAAETAGARFRLTDDGRRALWSAKGWEWGAAPGWQQERQHQLASIIHSATPTGSEVHMSPSGRYSLEVIEYETDEGRWNVTEGVVRRAVDGLALTTVPVSYTHLTLPTSDLV